MRLHHPVALLAAAILTVSFAARPAHQAPSTAVPSIQEGWAPWELTGWGNAPDPLRTSYVRRHVRAASMLPIRRHASQRIRTTPPPAPAGSGTPSGSYHGSVPDLIRSIFGRLAPGYVSIGLCVANRESRFLPTAYNHSSGASGVFQFLPKFWGGNLFDPVHNVTLAAEQFGSGNTSPWAGDGPACGF